MMDALRTIDGRAAAWAPVMLRACSQGGLALLAAYAVTRLLRRLPPAAKTWGWRLAYLKLLLALFWVAPVTLRVLHEATVPLSHARSEIVTAAVPSSRGPTEHSLDPARPATVPGPLVASSARVIAPAAINRPPVWRAALLAAWVAGALLGIARLGKKWRATRRLRAASQPVSDPDVLSRYLRISRDMGLSHPPKLLRGEIVGPLLIGVVRPAVVIPERIDSGLSLMLAHELAHFRRRDTLWALLPAAARVLFWFHPMVWLAEREWNVCTESACDQACLQATRAAPASYGRLLLDMASASCRRPAPLLAVGAAGSRYAIERRLRAMRYFTEWSSRRRVIVAAVLAFCGTVGLVPWRLVAQQSSSDEDRRGGGGRPAVSVPASRDVPATQPMDQAALREYFRKNVNRGMQLGRITCPTAFLQPPTAGLVRRVLCKEGDHVSQGELLIQLDSAGEQAELDAEKARLGLDEAELARKLELLKRNAISPSEAKVSVAQVEIQKAKLRVLEHHVAQTRITAPVSGVVTDCPAVEGQVVSAGATLGTIIDTSNLGVQFDAPSGWYSLLAAGEVVRCFANDDDVFDIKLTFVSPEVDPSSQYVKVKGIVVKPLAGLRPGLQVDVDLPDLRERHERTK